jgi:hypothetical protein
LTPVDAAAGWQAEFDEWLEERSPFPNNLDYAL